MRAARASGAGGKDIEEAIEIVDWGVRTFGSYVGTSDKLSIVL
jgi:hypothetical protein